MRKRALQRFGRPVAVLAAGIIFSVGVLVFSGGVAARAQTSDNVSVFATGLDNPRGLKFGPDGNLYVAEGGQGGTDSTIGQCDQVVAPVGPYTSGKTAHISKINSNGVRTIVVDNLPSSQTSPASGSFVSGVGDVAFIGDTLYGLLAGAGCSHGVPDVPNGVIRVNADGTWALVADLSTFLKANPVANPNPGDFEPDGTWYSVVSFAGRLWAVEPNHGELDQVTPAGTVRRVVDISATYGHIVPTALSQRGLFYIGNLSTFPLVEGVAQVLVATPSGHILPSKLTYKGLTGVLGLTWDHHGHLFALETSAPGFPSPGTGRVLRLRRRQRPEVIATGLTFPTAMTLGPDGALYVSNHGFGFPPGAGEVVRITIP